MDYSKCFDTINREKLSIKLQNIGVPFKICEILYSIYSQWKFFIRSGELLSKYFLSSIGLPQGDPLSPILFSIFTYDLPDILHNCGVKLYNSVIKYIAYADDLVIIAKSSSELQDSMTSLFNYCQLNGLKINVSKTKVQIFHKGALSKVDKEFKFTINNIDVERVSYFTYLGITFTNQLSFTKHIESKISQANARAGLLFTRAQLKNQTLDLAKAAFNTYILPIFRYGLPIYINGLTKTSEESLNRVYTKFLKRYLGVPKYTNNAIVYHITNSQPLSHTLKQLAPHSTKSISVPPELSGYQLKFIQRLPVVESYVNHHRVPSWFWLSQMLHQLPLDPYKRTQICSELIDKDHKHYCQTEKFHHKIEENCKCNACGNILSYYHKRFCTSQNDTNMTTNDIT